MSDGLDDDDGRGHFPLSTRYAALLTFCLSSFARWRSSRSPLLPLPLHTCEAGKSQIGPQSSGISRRATHTHSTCDANPHNLIRKSTLDMLCGSFAGCYEHQEYRAWLKGGRWTQGCVNTAGKSRQKHQATGSSNKIDQTWGLPLSRTLYTMGLT